MILSGQVFAQDSVCFSVKEARIIDQLLISGQECDSTLAVERGLSAKKDEKITELIGKVTTLVIERQLDGRVIDMHLHDKAVLQEKIRLQKRRNTATVGIASVVVLLSLFAAIR